MTIQTNRDLPLTFRAEIVTAIFQALAAGDSCSVVGIGSVGKSNLLRFLQREDVRAAQLGDEWATYLFVYVDINKILKLSRWGLFELMLHQLFIELTNQGADEKSLAAIDELHQRATTPQTQYLALRYLDRALGLVCNQMGLHLVFLFDEFDELCRRMAPGGFAALRALRDDYKYRLMYLAATRLELKRLREDVRQIEAFEELAASHTIWVGPYTDDDARLMLHRLEDRHKVALDEKSIEEILAATGGHPGLLREGYSLFRRQPADFLEALVNSPNTQDECQRIWFSLSPPEQRVMMRLVDNNSFDPGEAAIAERLHYKGLIRGSSNSGNQTFSKLFALYIKQQKPIVGARIHLDYQRHLVLVNGHEVRDLTPLEYKLMLYFVQKRGQVCSHDELAQHLYPDDMTYEGSGVTDTRLHSLVKRLRKRIEPNPKEPKYIQTVRGHGFRLVDGDG